MKKEEPVYIYGPKKDKKEEGKDTAVQGDVLLVEELNLLLYACFKEEPPEKDASHPPAQRSHILSLEERVNLGKTAGPNGVSGCYIRICADQLVGSL